MIHRVSAIIGGRELSIEVGRLAKQAAGAAYVRYGDTVVLATACAESEPKAGADFLPLIVDYREYNYAAGKIPGGFFKREGRPTEKEVLTSRLIDRPIRPMFPEGYNYETQVIAMVLSADNENSPEVLGLTGASTALFLSDIPFNTPLGSVRVGMIGDRIIINPSNAELKECRFNLMVAGSEDAIAMVEAGAKGVTEDEVLKALEAGHEAIREIVALQRQLQLLAGQPKRVFVPRPIDEALKADVASRCAGPISEALHTPGKLKSYARLAELKKELAQSYPEDQAEKRGEAMHHFESTLERVFRSEVLEMRRRPDGRAFDEIRNITIETPLLPRTHGSALFTRGETQALVTVTLGTAEDEQRLDTLEGEDSKRFMLHYNFPPFSVGEVSFLRSPGRREVGHGALAERALAAVVPDELAFPYTVRVVSDILESNGSSSMATVCAASLALFDGGAALKSAVAGIAMGLVKENDRVAILTDILGNEDHLGDMDFKVAGAKDGITAFQMDIKIRGISLAIMRDALAQAREGRMHILGQMEMALATPRPSLSPFAPRLTTIMIPVDMIGAVIGPGGKMIRQIVKDSGAEINIEDDGSVTIAATSQDAADKAIAAINRITEVPEIGKVYSSTVKKVMEFGAFVEFLPGKEGLVHVSQLDTKRVEKPSDVVKVGDVFDVKIIDKDDQGRWKLSRKVLMQPAGPPKEGEEAGTQGTEQGRDHHRGGHRDHHKRSSH